ncbi:tannase and feruloyl esterase-domain-containing protein [Aspergillus tetrazonus]
MNIFIILTERIPYRSSDCPRVLSHLHQEARRSGATILDLQANEIHNHTAYTISFCNVTVTHTHFGWNDTITTRIWLPLNNWNGRFQGLGGGGFSTGFGPIYLAYAVAQGFASASTDGGVPSDAGATTTIATDLSWALSSENNIGKQVTNAYYNRPAEYCYFSGCSGGGRQGLAMAQRFPDAFDGILAISPAINTESFIPAGYWPTQIMRIRYTHPPARLMHGVKDGIISLPYLCNVTAFDFVGKHYNCNGTQHSLSSSGAKVVQAAWSGSSSNTCHSPGAPLFGNWISYLIAKNPDSALHHTSEDEFFELLLDSKTEYASMLAANNPDMSEFKARAGKMIPWHGLADEAIPLGGLVEYYKQVLEMDSGAGEFFRSFEAPGVRHCYGGPRPVPNGALAQLMEWVAMAHRETLCPFPQKQVYVGGDPTNTRSFTCVQT